jgi:peroxiredoxin Q/BCP
LYGEFQKRDIIVLGISPDNASSHKKFIKKNNIPFPLLCDPDKKVMTEYAAFGEKNINGKVSMGVIRSTVWIGPDGKVKKHWEKVANAAEHPATVLKEIAAAG